MLVNFRRGFFCFLVLLLAWSWSHVPCWAGQDYKVQANYSKPNNPYSNLSVDGPPPAKDHIDPALASSYGCLIAGTLGTSMAIAAGSENVVNVVAGGLVTPASEAALTVAVIAVVFGSFCAVGQALTPIYLDIWGGE
jgi:hypothetical protein